MKPKRIRSFGDFHSMADSFASSDSSSDSSEPEKSLLDTHLTSEVIFRSFIFLVLILMLHYSHSAFFLFSVGGENGAGLVPL